MQQFFDCPFEVKFVSEEGAFDGYGSVFHVADRSNDVVAPGAFAQTLTRTGGEVRMLWQHDPSEPIGVWNSIQEDTHGLKVACRLLLDVQRGAEALALLKAGALDGLSIGYSVVEATVDPNTGLRTLTELDLWEISLVTFQACPGAAVHRVKTPPRSEGDAVWASLADGFWRAANTISTRRGNQYER